MTKKEDKAIETAEVPEVPAAKETKTEINIFSVTLFPAETGERVVSSKYSKENKGKKNRVDLSLPVPTTDEQAKRLYNMSLAQLIAKGVSQNSHDERILSGILNAREEEIDDDFLASFTKDAETAHYRTERETKVSTAKVAQTAWETLRVAYRLPIGTSIPDIQAEAIRRLGLTK